MPMRKDITPDFGKGLNDKKVVVPSSKTLAFIKQFARSYQVAKTDSLPDSLIGICVN